MIAAGRGAAPLRQHELAHGDSLGLHEHAAGTRVRVLNRRNPNDMLCVLRSAILTGQERKAWMDKVREVSDASFQQEVLESELPVLIDFWAPWCGPCRMISPVVEELAGEYEGRLKVVKMNVDNNPHTPNQYGVRGIPNLVLFRGGQPVDQIVGAVPKAHLVNAIERVLQ